MIKANLLPIRIVGDKVLKQIAEPVKIFDDELKEFIRDLVYTMYERDGVGLAAPQVGKSIRVFAIDPYWGDGKSKKNPIVLINPEIVSKEGEQVCEEGCISVPDIFDKINRFDEVVVHYQNEDGEQMVIEAEGFIADVLQHENDHLDGILFIDKLSKIKLLPHVPKLRKLKASVDKNGENIKY